jgi:hypothetical protein
VHFRSNPSFLRFPHGGSMNMAESSGDQSSNLEPRVNPLMPSPYALAGSLRVFVGKYAIA